MISRPTTLLALLVAAILAGLIARPYLDRSLFVSAEPRPVAVRGDLPESERSTIEIFEHVSPSVVQVAARAGAVNPMAVNPMEEDQGRGASGTGFIWDDQGHVVTNDHVVQGARELAVRLSTGEVVRAQLVGVAPNYDLAVLRITGARNLPSPVEIGASADLKVGQAALAIGNPFGLDQSLTSGIISALKRRLPTSAGREISNVIQTDAAINPGNSGGPLLDSAGRVIGVTTAIISPSGSNAGIGFAVPVDIVNRIVPQLIKEGRVPTPGIGIIAANEAVTTRLGIDGVVIVQAQPGSPAARAGLIGVNMSTGDVGDVIVEADGKPIKRLGDLTEEIERIGVGKQLKLTVSRNGQRRDVSTEIVDIGSRA